MACFTDGKKEQEVCCTKEFLMGRLCLSQIKELKLLLKRVLSNFKQLDSENLPAATLWKRLPAVLHKSVFTNALTSGQFPSWSVFFFVFLFFKRRFFGTQSLQEFRNSYPLTLVTLRSQSHYNSCNLVLITSDSAYFLKAHDLPWYVLPRDGWMERKNK